MKKKTVIVFLLFIHYFTLLTAGENAEFWTSRQKQAHSLYFEEKNYQAVLDLTDFPGLYQPIDNLHAENGFYSKEQYSFLRLWWLRAYSAYFTGKYDIAIEAYEAYLNQTKYITTPRTRFEYSKLAESYVKTGNLKMAYQTLDHAIGNHKPLQSESEAVSNSFLYYERKNYIREYGQKEETILWAEEIYKQHHREGSVFAKAAETAFELKRDEEGVLWYLRFVTSQYDKYGQHQNTIPPFLSKWKRELRGESTAALDFCTVLYNLYLGIQDTEQWNRASESKWGKLLPSDKQITLKDLLEIRLAVQKSVDKQFLFTLLDICHHYFQYNDYENALSVAELMKDKALLLFSKDSQTYFSLSLLYAKYRYFTGDLSGSLDYFRELEDQGKSYPDEYRSILNFEAVILGALGRPEETLTVLKKVEYLTGPYSKEMIALNEKKAAANTKLGNMGEAERLFNKAIEQRMISLPKKINPEKISDFTENKIWDLILSLNKRASYFYKNNSYDKAEQDFEQMAELFPYINMGADDNEGFSRLTSRFLLMFEILLDMADLLIAMDDLETADQVINSLRDNWEIMEDRASQSDFIIPQQLFSHMNLTLAKYLEETGDPTRAVKHLEKAETYYQDLVSAQWDYLNEREKGQILSRIKPLYKRFHELAMNYGNESVYIAETGYEKTLESKAVLLKASRKLRSFIASGSSEIETALKYKEWLENRRLLARYYCGITSISDASVITNLEKTVSDLERELFALTGDSITTGQNHKKIESEEIILKIPLEEAVVEIVQVGDETYIAYVIRGENKKVNIINIGPVDDIDLAYEQWRSFIENSKNRTALDRMLPSSEYTQTRQHLYNRLWKPLELALQGVKRIYFSGDGIYLTFNPATLQQGNNKYIEDSYSFINLSTSADIAEATFHKDNSPPEGDIVLLGDPRFHFDNSIETKNINNKTRSYDFYNRMDFHPENVASLPGTRSEVEKIGTILTENGMNPVILLGKDSIESSIKNVHSPQVLHLATHGFFHEDKDDKTKNPLLSSGLLLAGCENGADAQQNMGEDGILTAYEALDMDLSETKIVILSACETALGKRVNGEGVFGLQRALTIAGTDYLLMSLWSVDDFATSLFMSSFYEIWLEGHSIPEAYSLTVDAVRSEYEEPFYWGAFILMGME